MELIGHDRNQAQKAKTGRQRPLSMREALLEKIKARNRAGR